MNVMVERKRIKSIQLRVEYEIHEKLKAIKGEDRTWEEFLVEAGLKYVKAEDRNEC